MMGLTEIQAKAKAYIAGNINETGASPSYSEIGAHVGVTSKGRVHKIISDLVERGHVRRAKYRSRALEVISPQPLAAYSSADLIAELDRRGLIA